MSIFDDNSSHRLSRSEAEDAINRTGTLSTSQRAYVRGYFDAVDDRDGIRGDTIERALDNLRDRTDDDVSGDEVEALRENLEAKFTESLS